MITRTTLPDLRGYRPHRSVEHAAFEGTAVPGLSADYLRRENGDRTGSVGRYRYAGVEVLLAWGWTDEPHCRFSAVRAPDGQWRAPTEGCPQVEILRDRGEVIGVRFGDGDGGWLTCRAGTVTSG